MDEKLEPIPAGRPPWLRELHEAEQRLALTAVEPGGLSIGEVGATIDDPEGVVWVWKDLPRQLSERVIAAGDSQRTGGLAELDEGSEIEVLLGGLSGYPSAIFRPLTPRYFSKPSRFSVRRLSACYRTSPIATSTATHRSNRFSYRLTPTSSTR